jgi:hypothetical protein
MRLNKILMVGIVIACVLFAYLLKLEKYEGFSNTSPDYKSLMTVYKQIELLKYASTKLDAIPVTNMDYTEKAAIKERIDLVEKQLQGWITDRITYLNKNNVIETKPNTNETLDGLKNIWLGKDGSGGIRILVTNAIDKLDPTDDSQGSIIELMETVTKNIDSEIS